MRRNLLFLGVFLACAVIAYLLINNNKSSGIQNNPLTDFAIEDTSAVEMIFIANAANRSVLLKRSQHNRHRWTLNDSLIARKDLIQLILKTFKNVMIQQPVAQSARANVIKRLATSHRKIEIYGKNNTLLKTWFVGDATQNSQGTYALVEDPVKGRSSEPYILDMKGFRGYLSSRFPVDETEWRSTEVFLYPELKLKSVKVELPKNKGESFEINVEPVSLQPALTDAFGKKYPGANETFLRKYLLAYKKIHLEAFTHGMKSSTLDSLGRQTPDYRITVRDLNDEEKSISLFYIYRIFDTDTIEHPDRMKAIFGRDTVKVQRETFDPLLVKKSDFL